MSVRRTTGRIQRIQRMDLPAAFEAWQSGASQAALPQLPTMFTAKQGGADTAPPQVSVRPDGCRWGAGRICLASSHMKDSSNIEQHTNRSLGNPEIGELKFNDNDLAELFYALARIPKHPTVTLNERTAKGCPHPFLTRKPNMFWLVVSTPLKNMSSSIEIILHNL